MITVQQQQQIIQKLLPYSPERIAIFGSYARGENLAHSDLDILVSLRQRLGLLWLIEIEQGLSQTLGIQVDLVTEKSLNHAHLKDSIYRHLVLIYEDKD